MEPSDLLTGKKILLIIGGGIAAYKSLELIRRLKGKGADVTGVLTQGGAQFITPLSVSSLTGNPCYQDLFDAAQEGQMGHIELSRAADLILVAPATANLMARMANGFAQDLASTVLLATDTPVMIAPAMNVRMWTHVATQRNLAQLERDGIHMVGPDEGDMACDEFGLGRMSEPDVIVDNVIEFFEKNTERPLDGFSVLVTAGPTHEPIDPVRYIANRSSGKQGYAIAAAAHKLGASVTLVTGPTALATPPGVVRIDVETALEMHDACKEALPVDIAVFAAAVGDWRPETLSKAKIKKTGDKPPLFALIQNPDILKTIATAKTDRPRLVIGFAAETDNVRANAQTKVKQKGCDWILANDVSPHTGIMGGDINRVELISKDGVDSWPEMSKDNVADKLMQMAAAFLARQSQQIK